MKPKIASDTYISPFDRQHFVIGHDAWLAASPEEVGKTVEGLKELNLYALPFDVVDIDILADDAIRFCGPDGIPTTSEPDAKGSRLIDGKSIPPLGPNAIYRVVGLTAIENFPLRTFLIDFTSGWSEETTKYLFATLPRADKNSFNTEGLRRALCDLLIVLLATRNAEKVHHENKLFKLGIGKKSLRPERAYRYTTSISVPGNDIEDDEEHAPTGIAKAPHLRRGHVRRQHYGPGNNFVKKIWIDPVFVNADEDFVAKREQYNLSVKQPRAS